MVFFDDRSMKETVEAWEEATETSVVLCSAPVSVFKPTKYRGQWDKEAGVVGHRKYGDIMDDILQSVHASNDAENTARHEEMHMLSSRFKGL